MKLDISRPGAMLLLSFKLFLLMLFLGAQVQISHAQTMNKLTVNFSHMSPHVGQDLWLAVIDAETMVEVRRVHAVAALEFVMEIPEVLEDGKSYNVDFFADLNMNGKYDPPGTDHAWRLEIVDASGDETLDFGHQIAFTDVEWKHRLRLSLSGMSANIGQEMFLYVRDLDTGAYLDTILVEAIPGDEFAMDSYVIHPAGTYLLDFYIDLNGNGSYDVPPIDQAWRLETDETVGDLELEFAHNLEFTDIFQITGLSQVDDGIKLTVYPNPASTYLNISMESQAGEVMRISVLSQAGSVLLQTEEISPLSLNLDIGHLADGMYILQVETDSQRSISPFIKQ